jgi:hypothetical protein
MYIFPPEDVVRPKRVVGNLNKIVKNYWNRITLDGNPWTWTNTRNRMQTPKFKRVENVWDQCAEENTPLKVGGSDRRLGKILQLGNSLSVRHQILWGTLVKKD